MGKNIQARVGVDVTAGDKTGPATKSAANNFRQLGVEVERTDQKMAATNTKGQRRFGRGIFELSRGVEDFGQQFSVGIDQALRASANNFTQFAAVTLSPLAAILTSVGVGLAFLVPVLVQLARESSGAAVNVDEFKNGLDELLALFQKNRAVDKFSDTLNNMDFKQFTKTQEDLQKTIRFTETEISQLETKMRSQLSVVGPEGLDLAAAALTPRAHLQDLVRREEALLSRISSGNARDLSGGVGAGGDLPNKVPVKRQNELRDSLRELRESIGVDDNNSLKDLLNQLEALEKKGVAIGDLEQEITRRRREGALAQEKINLMRQQEDELIKKQLAKERERLKTLNQINSAIGPRTQAFQAGLARAQLGVLDETKPIGGGINANPIIVNPEEKRLLERNNQALEDLNAGVDDMIDALEENGTELVMVDF
jgi:hypothetical protein